VKAAKSQSRKPTGRPTADAGRRKLARLLEVASDQFGQLGYRAVTMRGVAAKAHVSTRTLYNRYADKLSLFTACLDFGSQTFPVPDPEPGESPESVLKRYAAAVVRALSTPSSLRMGMLVFRDGLEFPELLRVAQVHEDRCLIQPLAEYLRRIGLELADGKDRAKLFLGMALIQWQRAGSYRQPPPTEDEVVRHAELCVHTFLLGVRPVDTAAGHQGPRTT